jgi:hypothetical protein
VTQRHGHCVTVHEPQGWAVVAQVGSGTKGTAQGEFNSPCGVAELPNGDLAIGDQWNHRVMVHRLDGRFVRQIGSGVYGDGDNEFSCPLRRAPTATWRCAMR